MVRWLFCGRDYYVQTQWAVEVEVNDAGESWKQNIIQQSAAKEICNGY